MPRPKKQRRSRPEKKRFFDFDLLVLLMIGGITLLAAGYTLLPELLTGESQHSEETNASAPTESTQLEITEESTAAIEKTAPATTATPPAAAVGWVSAIGDSVMLGALDALEQDVPNLALIDVQGSRQAPTAIDILRQRRAANQLGEVVVVDIGNNGPFSAEQFDEMMQVLASVRRVLIVNLTVPPGVKDPIAVPNNTVLAEGVKRYPNAVLVDWRAASASHPEYFGEDHIHLTLEGAQAYSALIATNVGVVPQSSSSSQLPPGPKERISWGEGGSFGECVGLSSWCSVP